MVQEILKLLWVLISLIIPGKKGKHIQKVRYMGTGIRMSLWAEHLGIIDACFKDPCSLECVRFVNRIAEDNWVRYTAEDIIPLTGHLLKYPIDVDIDGKLVPRSGCETFPDVGGKILGEPIYCTSGRANHVIHFL
ncbi:hypothetical protein Cni_G01890 [Canna indica]|uniref:Phospholipase D C-terminal domain-containing protein n=1 Tax=Canna indica TaxID=4628 RepID=A0AAQ3JP18_9LILI|nr:hypothetical protein Cni_G01890 [Canna indica]